MSNCQFECEKENIYLNIDLSSEGVSNVNVDFNDHRVAPILKNASDYELGVIRFSIPATNIPIFFFDSNDIDYHITLRDSLTGTFESEQLVFKNLETQPNAYGLQAIWSYQQFIDMVNTAFATAFTNLKALEPLALPTEAPFYTYEASTELFKFNAEQVYDDTNPLTKTFEIWVSSGIFKILSGFQVISDNVAFIPLGNQIIIKDNCNNSFTYNAKAYYYMEQEYKTTPLWYGVKRFLFLSNLPVRPEVENGTLNITQNIIMDFVPLVQDIDRQKYQFFTSGYVRYYDMISVEPLKTLNLTVAFETNYGKILTVKLAPHEYFNMKIHFKKKIC